MVVRRGSTVLNLRNAFSLELSSRVCLAILAVKIDNSLHRANTNQYYCTHLKWILALQPMTSLFKMAAGGKFKVKEWFKLANNYQFLISNTNKGTFKELDKMLVVCTSYEHVKLYYTPVYSLFINKNRFGENEDKKTTPSSAQRFCS